MGKDKCQLTGVPKGDQYALFWLFPYFSNVYKRVTFCAINKSVPSFLTIRISALLSALYSHSTILTSIYPSSIIFDYSLNLFLCCTNIGVLLDEGGQSRAVWYCLKANKPAEIHEWVWIKHVELAGCAPG